MITRREANAGSLASAAAAATPQLAAAQEAQAITSPSPRHDGGAPLLRRCGNLLNELPSVLQRQYTENRTVVL